MAKNYIFDVELKSQKIHGYNIEARSVEAIKNLRPSQLDEQEVRSGWIKFSNDKYTQRQMKETEGGKWILRFPKGHPDIDKVWPVLVDGVANGTLWDMKVSSQNNKYPHQTFCIYTKDKNDIHAAYQVYRFLDKKGLIALHDAQAELNQGTLEYISDEGTRKKEFAPIYTRKEMEAYQQQLITNKQTINEIREKLQKHIYELHRGGKTVPGDAKVYSEGASQILKKIKELDTQDDILSHEAYRAIIAEVDTAIAHKTEPKKGFFLFGWGGRELSTANLYKEVLQICNLEPKLAQPKETITIETLNDRDARMLSRTRQW